MLKAVEKLVTSNHDLTCGNHRVEFNEERGHLIANYWYHSTIICSVDYNAKTFKTTDGGWSTQSTNRAINDYRKYYNTNCYTEIFTYMQMGDMVEYLFEVPTGSMMRVYFDGTSRVQITITKKSVNNEKFCDVVFSKEDKVTSHSFKYKGYKSFRENFLPNALAEYFN